MKEECTNLEEPGDGTAEAEDTAEDMRATVADWDRKAALESATFVGYKVNSTNPERWKDKLREVCVPDVFTYKEELKGASIRLTDSWAKFLDCQTEGLRELKNSRSSEAYRTMYRDVERAKQDLMWAFCNILNLCKTSAESADILIEYEVSCNRDQEERESKQQEKPME